MPEWLYEAGIGEARAALVEGGVITQAIVERDGTLTVGTVVTARLGERRPGRAAVAVMADGGEIDLVAPPTGVSQGTALSIRIVREALPEPGRIKPPRGTVTDDPPAPGPDLHQRIAATGFPVRRLYPHDIDALEAAGWSEVLEEADTGDIAFPGGLLRMIPTPAMTLFDVDGSGPLEPLAIAAAGAVAHAVVRHGIGGSIGIDFPTLAGKGPRRAVAAAIEAVLPMPFERTTANGFGFLQIVRPRPRPSLPELLHADPVGAAARAALRRIERTPPGSPCASPPARRHCCPDRFRAGLDRGTPGAHRRPPHHGTLMTTPSCPICSKPSAPDYAPFCSRGCRDRDLLQWLGEGYRLPGRSATADGLDSGSDED